MTKIAYFITPHGFGHAARAAAVMKAIHKSRPDVHFDLFTHVPRWFFNESTPGIFTYHETLTDIGLVQQSPLEEDVPATIKKLQSFLPFEEQSLAGLQTRLTQSKSQLVLCDISPLGIAAAERARIPSILIENFTWDWIYESYAENHPQISDYICMFRRYFQSADFHIQTRPVCNVDQDCDLTTLPISRSPNHSRSTIRKQLGVSDSEKVILVSMGGIQHQFRFLAELPSAPNYRFVIPGGSETLKHQDNLILLPFHSSFYHPDLLYASDAVVGKVGYSTLAETYQAGIPFGFVARSAFRELSFLSDFIMEEMYGIQLPEEEFNSGNWIDTLTDLTTLPTINRKGSNGTLQAANFITEKISNTP